MAFYGDHPVVNESVSAVTATPSTDLGTIRCHAGADYMYVYAVGTISQYCGAILTGTSGYSVVATGAVSGQFAMGFAVHDSIPAGSYGWLFQRGVANIKNGMASTALAVTDNIYLATDGQGVFGRTTVTTNAVSDGHVIGKLLSAGASGGTGGSLSLVYVKC